MGDWHVHHGIKDVPLQVIVPWPRPTAHSSSFTPQPQHPTRRLGIARSHPFAVEGHGNDGVSLIGGKVAALAVMIDAILGLLLRLSPLWLVRVVIGSFSVLHTSETKFTRIMLYCFKPHYCAYLSLDLRVI